MRKKVPRIQRMLFVFKASKGRGRKYSAEGDGGWPLTATKVT